MGFQLSGAAILCCTSFAGPASHPSDAADIIRYRNISEIFELKIMAAPEITAQTDNLIFGSDTMKNTNTGKPTTDEHATLDSANTGALPGFHYENGYTLLGTDLGGSGVKIELIHKYEGSAAIILPPQVASECARWLLQTLGQINHTLPKELPDILERIIKQKDLDQVLKRGDKKKIKDALKILKKQCQN